MTYVPSTVGCSGTAFLPLPGRAANGSPVLPVEPHSAARYFALLLELNEVAVVDALASLTAVEPAAARLLAGSRTESDLSELSRCVEALRAEARREIPDAVALTGHVRRFHELLVSRAGSQTLAAQVGAVQSVVAAHTFVAVASACGSDWAATSVAFSKVARSYDTLVRLLQEQAADAAHEHWARHMGVAGSALLRWSKLDLPVGLWATGL